MQHAPHAAAAAVASSAQQGGCIRLQGGVSLGRCHAGSLPALLLQDRRRHSARAAQQQHRGGALLQQPQRSVAAKHARAASHHIAATQAAGRAAGGTGGCLGQQAGHKRRAAAVGCAVHIAAAGGGDGQRPGSKAAAAGSTAAAARHSKSHGRRLLCQRLQHALQRSGCRVGRRCGCQRRRGGQQRATQVCRKAAHTHLQRRLRQRHCLDGAGARASERYWRASRASWRHQGRRHCSLPAGGIECAGTRLCLCRRCRRLGAGQGSRSRDRAAAHAQQAHGSCAAGQRQAAAESCSCQVITRCCAADQHRLCRRSKLAATAQLQRCVDGCRAKRHCLQLAVGLSTHCGHSCCCRGLRLQAEQRGHCRRGAAVSSGSSGQACAHGAHAAAAALLAEAGTAAGEQQHLKGTRLGGDCNLQHAGCADGGRARRHARQQPGAAISCRHRRARSQLRRRLGRQLEHGAERQDAAAAGGCGLQQASCRGLLQRRSEQRQLGARLYRLDQVVLRSQQPVAAALPQAGLHAAAGAGRRRGGQQHVGVRALEGKGADAADHWSRCRRRQGAGLAGQAPPAALHGRSDVRVDCGRGNRAAESDVSRCRRAM